MERSLVEAATIIDRMDRDSSMTTELRTENERLFKQFEDAGGLSGEGDTAIEAQIQDHLRAIADDQRQIQELRRRIVPLEQDIHARFEQIRILREQSNEEEAESD